MNLFLLLTKSALGLTLTCADVKEMAAAGRTEVAFRDRLGEPIVVPTSEVACIQAIPMPASLRLDLYRRVKAAPLPVAVKAGRLDGPGGVRVDWSVSGCVLLLKLYNLGSVPVELDWMRSVWATRGQAAAPLMPGSSSRTSAMISIPPLVAPAGGFAEELVFRKDNLPSDGDGCLFYAPEKAVVTLKISGSWYTQPLEMFFEGEQAAREEAILAEVTKAREALELQVAAEKAAEAERVAAEKAAEEERKAADLARRSANLTCADLRGLQEAKLSEEQFLEVVKGQTIPAVDLECIQGLGLPSSILQAVRVVGTPAQ